MNQGKVKTIKKFKDFLLLLLFPHFAGVFISLPLRKDRARKAYLLGESINIGQVVAGNKLGKFCDSFHQHVGELYFNYFFVFHTKELVVRHQIWKREEIVTLM